MGTFKDLTGAIVGRLTITGKYPEKTVHGKIQWNCRCECGVVKVYTGNDLGTGRIVSCGCRRKEAAIETGHANTTHGLRNTDEYAIWQGIKQRCLNPNGKSYDQYGERGIVIDSRWIDSFENFFADMGPRPDNTYSIERNDVNGPYSPSNCRWATMKEQQNNRRNNVRHEIDGQSLTSAECARMIGVSRSSFQHYLKKGESTEDILKRYRSYGTFTK